MSNGCYVQQDVAGVEDGNGCYVQQEVTVDVTQSLVLELKLLLGDRSLQVPWS